MIIRTSGASRRSIAAAAAVAVGASMVVASSASADVVPKIDRLSGDNRFETAVAISEELNDSCELALVNGRSFPDGLTAAVFDLPILLTEADSLPAATVAELERLEEYCRNDTGRPPRVTIVGGTAAVSAEVREEVIGIVGEYRVERISGDDRYATALAVADAFVAEEDEDEEIDVILATGENFPDALAAGPVAARFNSPILLNNGSELRADVEEWLVGQAPRTIRNVIILGGESAIPAAVESRLTGPLGLDVVRLGGANRAATAVEIAEYWTGAEGARSFCARVTTLAGECGPQHLTLVNSDSFADALAASAWAAYHGSPILLVNQNSIPAETAAFHVKYCKTVEGNLYLGPVAAIGGTAAVSASVLKAATAATICEVPTITSATLAVSDLKARVISLGANGGDDIDGAKLTAVGPALGTVANAWTVTFDYDNAGPSATIVGTNILYKDNFDSLTTSNFVTNWNASAAGTYFQASLASTANGEFTNTPDNITTADGTPGSYDATVVITFSTNVDEPSCFEVWSTQNPATASVLLDTCDATQAPATWPATGGASTVTYSWNDVNDRPAPAVPNAGLYDDGCDFEDTVTGECSDEAIIPLTAPAS